MNNTFYGECGYLAHRSHKYVAKIKGAGAGGKTLYFYTQEAYQAYLKSKTRKADYIKGLDDDIQENKAAIKEDLHDMAAYASGDKSVNNLGKDYEGSKFMQFNVRHILYNARNMKVSQLEKARLQKRYKVTRAGTSTAVTDTGTGTRKKRQLKTSASSNPASIRLTRRAKRDRLNRARAIELARR